MIFWEVAPSAGCAVSDAEGLVVASDCGSAVVAGAAAAVVDAAWAAIAILPDTTHITIQHQVRSVRFSRIGYISHNRLTAAGQTKQEGARLRMTH